MDTNETSYKAHSIKVLKGLEAVRKRPGMFVGDTESGAGLHQLVSELIDNAVDENFAGHCTEISVILHKDGSAEVRDNGRGIPVDFHQDGGCSAAEVIMTTLHAGGKFDQNSYKVAGGLHGVGVSVVNALSEHLALTIYRDGKEYFQEYRDGVPQGALSVVGDSALMGTTVRFSPSPKVFKDRVINYQIVKRRIKELSFLHGGLKLDISDLRTGDKEEYLNSEGLRAFVQSLNIGHNPIHSSVFYFSGTVEQVEIEVALQWCAAFQERLFGYTNSIPQSDGGAHVTGFRSVVTRKIKQFIKNEGYEKKGKLDLKGEDTREGITAVISVRLSDPKFSSQTKTKLVSSGVESAVSNSFGEKLYDFLLENPEDSKAIIGKICEAARAREAAHKARDIVRKKILGYPGTLPGKLADCEKGEQKSTELFLVEGDSAGGSAKQARDRKTQAVLPMKGKILNVEKVHPSRVLSSGEIGTLIAALGCGTGEEFDLSKLRYDRIIIMTDADVDGAHILTLLLTFFYRFMHSLVINNFLYIAMPPLYKVKSGKTEKFLEDERALDETLTEIAIKGSSFFCSGTPEPLPKEKFASLMLSYRKAHNAGKRLFRLHDAGLVKSMLVIPGLSPEAVLQDQDTLHKWAEHLCESAKASKVGNCSFQIQKNGDGGWEALVFEIQKPGRTKTDVYRGDFFQSGEYREIYDHTSNLDDVEIAKESTIQRGKNSGQVSSFEEAAEWVLADSHKGLMIQRYKGLGEMNPDQLWETTMDPEKRRMIQVRVNDLRAVEETFDILMGENVEPRREFIEAHALQTGNLDV